MFGQKINTDKDKINDILTRSVAEIIEKGSVEKKLASGKQLRIKLGIDPTAPHIHIGRAVVLWKMRALQELGHKVVIIIGDFTGLVGDTSDKKSERPMLTEAEIKKNMKLYLSEIGKIIDIKKAEVHYNSKWLSKLGFLEIAKQADQFSVHDFISRELIAKRLEEGKRISLRELLYPLMQGYDSVAINADIEMGGTDQKFNILAGRVMQRLYGKKEQDVFLCDIIEGLDGEKMSTSKGNGIFIVDTPQDMYGKVMSLKDSLIISYFIHTTRVDRGVIRGFEEELRNGKNPKEIKMILARELVSLYHGVKEADKAEKEFQRIFEKGGTPEDVTTIEVREINEVLAHLIKKEVVASASEWHRLVKEGAISVEGNRIDSVSSIKSGDVIKIGKRRFVKVVIL